MTITHGRGTESWGRLESLPGFEMQIMAGWNACPTPKHRY